MHVEARCWDVKEETCGEKALNPHLLVMVKKFIRKRKERVDLLLDQRLGEEGVSRECRSFGEARCTCGTPFTSDIPFQSVEGCLEGNWGSEP